MQQIAHRHSQMIIDENKRLHSELESNMNELDLRSKQLDELAARSDYDRRNLKQDRQMVRECDFLPVVLLFVSLDKPYES